VKAPFFNRRQLMLHVEFSEHMAGAQMSESQEFENAEVMRLRSTGSTALQ